MTAMRVRIFHSGEGGMESEATARECDLRDAIPDDAEYEVALAELLNAGRTWIGGGAAPLFFVQRIRG